MKPQKSSKKNLIIGIAIVVIAAVAYFFFLGDSATTNQANTGGSLAQSQVSNTVGARVLSLLNQIRTLKIDTTIFSGDTFKSLVDYSIAIPEVPVGRPNPFAPIPGVALPSSQNPSPAR